jgi:hypothetical protein
LWRYGRVKRQVGVEVERYWLDISHHIGHWEDMHLLGHHHDRETYPPTSSRCHHRNRLFEELRRQARTSVQRCHVTP